MKRKQLLRVLGAGSLALSLLVSPMTGVSALAAEDNPTETPAAGDAADKKEGGSVKGVNPLQEAVANYQPAYADTEIPVWGFTQDTTVYSVDVEWGAMTFCYENSTWDATAHQSVTGGGWRVYDSETGEALDAAETSINRIQVTNHSNAEVKAALAYAGRTGYEDTTGSFAKAADDADTSYDGTALTLASADNNKGEAEGQGKATVGCVYFMPSGIKEDYKTAGITKWTQLGTITVGVETADQKEATD